MAISEGMRALATAAVQHVHVPDARPAVTVAAIVGGRTPDDIARFVQAVDALPARTQADWTATLVGALASGRTPDGVAGADSALRGVDFLADQQRLGAHVGVQMSSVDHAFTHQLALDSANDYGGATAESVAKYIADDSAGAMARMVAEGPDAAKRAIASLASKQPAVAVEKPSDALRRAAEQLAQPMDAGPAPSVVREAVPDVVRREPLRSAAPEPIDHMPKIGVQDSLTSRPGTFRLSLDSTGGGFEPSVDMGFGVGMTFDGRQTINGIAIG